MNEIASGVFRLTLGTPESITPAALLADHLNRRHFDGLPEAGACPVDIRAVAFAKTPRGCRVTIPLGPDEQIYGFGLQMKSFNQNGKKKTVRVNADAAADTGDSHAPVPLYVSNAGYAVLFDTARYASFYCGSHYTAGRRVPERAVSGDNTDELYRARGVTDHMLVDVPAAAGVDVYVFAGPDMMNAVRRYNLFSGGGYAPPLWGLGVWYRTYAQSGHGDVTAQAAEFRGSGVPCDVYGLEPGWQSHQYSCSYTWNKTNFPHPEDTLKELERCHFRVNLWEHLFIHETSPLYEKLKPYAGDYEVWGGIVPDFSIEEAAGIFREYHKRAFLDNHVAGFKFDECDNSDYIQSPWSYPECSRFPSGMDGEQMHSVMGMLYQKMILPAVLQNNRRTLSQVRASHAFAASFPFVLYSDLYDHKEFVTALANAGFAGLSWSPEVRQCESVGELYRRAATAVFSPMTLINAWMIPHPPWKQVDRELNKQGIFLENADEVTAHIQELFELRMSLIPYLYAAYFEYYLNGTPPFRALVLDYPDDRGVFYVDDQYMMGGSIMAAPLFENQESRSVYLPEGKWHDFFGNRVWEGPGRYDLPADGRDILVFVKDNSILPLAVPQPFVPDPPSFEIVPRIFGASPEPFLLYEDDGATFDFTHGVYNIIRITCENGAPVYEKSGNFQGQAYRFHP